MEYRDGIVKNTEFFTTSELAKKLKMNVQVITRKVQSGEIKAYKIGKDWRIPENSVHTWLESKVNSTHKRNLTENSNVKEALSKSEMNTSLSNQPSSRKYLLEYILAQFEPNRDYTEEQVNRIIARHHSDCQSVRQEFLSEKMMDNSGKNFRRRTGYKVSD